MVRFHILFAILIITELALSCGTREYNAESLRRDLEKLMKGQLNFTDEIPFYKDELLDITPKNKNEYDFIVIGAGSAGATIASRLSEVKNVTVLLIEAGSKEYPIMDIPLLSGYLQLSNEINWAYETESSDKYCLGLKDRKCSWPRAKVMGGCSVLNYMLATRCNKRDYNDWANVTGDQSWSYEKMLKYFKKLENFNVKGVYVDENLHNKNGPVHITTSSYRTKFSEAFVKAGKELGYPSVDYNGAEQSGFFYYQLTINNGERWSTNRAYLYPAKDRKNLLLTRNSHVNKILINKETKKAYGVQFTKFGRNIEVKAKKEIILSAGAIGSPQILMLSGIGPAKHLHDLNIDVVKNSPVGENLMDHIAYGGLIFKVNDSSTYKSSNLLDPENPSINAYVDSRSGPLSMGSGYEAIGYVDIDNLNQITTDPSIEFFFGALSGIKDPITAKTLRVSEENINKMNADVFNHSAFTIWPMILKPKSRGKLVLKSKNPNDKPLLYANYLDNPEDIRILIGGIRAVLKLTETRALKKYGAELYQVPLDCGNHVFDSDAYWECALRTYSFTIYHQTGTCKMGSRDDKTAVVDSNLKVIGIKGLRVADGSIMPEIVSAHPNIPIIAIGEKISDEIKQDWNFR